MSRSFATSGPATGGSPSVPPVMGVRCYWSLVTPRYPRPDVPGSELELVFIHPDPVLSVHLARQKMTLIGRGVIEFIHPAEREQARKDLGNSIASDDLQGSVTRVRFARLSRIRMILGAPPDEVEMPTAAAKVVEDDEWMVIDVVLNWIADGLLLVFFHAIKDTDPMANNDPNRREEGWSNFCGTANMGDEQIEALHRDIASAIAPAAPSRFPPTRVFQLHSTPPSPTIPGRLLFSWPPSRHPDSAARFDGLYDAEEYGDLLKGVEMDPSQLLSTPGEVKTTCTTRFGAKHIVTSEGVYRHITSVFIPYGSVIFACFQTTKLVELLPRQVQDGQVMAPGHRQGQEHEHRQNQGQGQGLGPGQGQGRGQDGYHSVSPGEWEHQSQHPPPLPPLQGHSHLASSHPYPQQHRQLSPIAPAHEWRRPVDDYDARLHSLKYPHSHPSRHHQTSHPDSHYQSHGAPLLPPPLSHHDQSHPHPHLHHLPPLPHPHSHPHPHPHINPSHPHAATPLKRHPSNPGLGDPPYAPPSTGYDAPDGSPGYEGLPGQPNPGNLSSRPLIRPPGNVESCRICGIRESPEWRRGETGVKDLCNACGLRLARQVAKREGKQKPRKKKDRPA